MGLHQIIFDVDDYDDRDDMSKLFNSQDDDELDVIAPTSRWQLLSHAVGGSEVGLRDYTVHRIIFDDDDEDDRDDMPKLFNSQDDDELDVIAPTAPPSPSITRTERVKSKRQSRLQRELESSLDGVKWSSGTASPSLPITGVEGQEAISEGLKGKKRSAEHCARIRDAASINIVRIHLLTPDARHWVSTMPGTHEVG
jgi:hypothetical protein